MRARIALHEINSLASTEQCLANNEVVLPCANVSVVMIYTHVSAFSFCMNRKYATATMVGATSAFCAVQTDRRLQALMIKQMLLPPQDCFATVYETAAIIEIS